MFFCINNDSKSKLSVDNAIKIINSIYLIKPDTVCIYENHKTKLIAAIGNFDNNVIGERSIKVIEKIGEEWLELYKSDISLPDSIYDIEWITDGKKPYLFINYLSIQGSGGYTSYYFSIVAPYEKKNDDLELGDNHTLQTDPRTLPYPNEIKSILMSKISHFKVSDSASLDSPQKAEQKWVLENRNLYNKIWESPLKINMTYYKDTLFNLFKNSISSQTENSNYLFKSYFKSSVVGLNKKENKYFIIWVPEIEYDWIDSMDLSNRGDSSFLNLHKGDEKLLVNLNNFTIIKSN